MQSSASAKAEPDFYLDQLLEGSAIASERKSRLAIFQLIYRPMFENHIFSMLLKPDGEGKRLRCGTIKGGPGSRPVGLPRISNFTCSVPSRSVLTGFPGVSYHPQSPEASSFHHCGPDPLQSYGIRFFFLRPRMAISMITMMTMAMSNRNIHHGNSI